VTLIVRMWMLMFWLPLLASTTAGCLALGRGMLAQPVPVLLWFLAALLLQFVSGQFSAAWTVGLVAQTALAIYLSIRLKLEG
jgi:hypothetical protein